jgi:hypothetical protein
LGDNRSSGCNLRSGGDGEDGVGKVESMQRQRLQGKRGRRQCPRHDGAAAVSAQRME